MCWSLGSWGTLAPCARTRVAGGHAGAEVEETSMAQLRPPARAAVAALADLPIWSGTD